LQSIGKATQFKPGVCSDPGGRPRKLPLTEAYEAILGRKFPGDPQKRTFAELIAEGQAKAAIKGKTEAAREMCDRVEGKVTLAISGPQGAPIPMALDLGVSPGTSAHDQLRIVTSRVRDRLAKLAAQSAGQPPAK
jgi:Family of unknown function (DUF5681)